MIEPGSTSESGFTYIGETVLHEGFVISVAQGEFETPEGDRITRDIVHHPGAVAVVLGKVELELAGVVDARAASLAVSFAQRKPPSSLPK